LGANFMVFMPKVRILNIDVDNLSTSALLKRLRDGGVVFTANVDHLMKLQFDRDFYEAYMLADYRVCDSQILKFASLFLGTPLQERISGSDLFPKFCEYYGSNDNVKIFLLGGGEGVAMRAMQRINRMIGREIIVAAHSPSFGFEKNQDECKTIISLINRSGANVLAVGVGAPKQEKWICQYKHLLPEVKVFMGIGATIDFEAGKVRRAPNFVSDLGLEWLYRLIQEPSRLWRRYLIEDMGFIVLILKQRFNIYRWNIRR
jgi:N-acetylglucosaminyldiphosphoundecaprenol N-acetyl-beta-D-mannosaminyltransferase